MLLLLQKVFLTPEELKAWGWRIPFVIGACLAIFAAVMRRSLQETDAFVEAKKAVNPTGSIVTLLNYPKELLLVVGLTAGGTAAFYTFTTYMQTFVKLSVGLTEDETTLVIFGSLIFATILQPIYGMISDRIGRKPLLIFFGVVGTLSTVPILMTLKETKSPLIAFLLDLRRLDLRRRLHLDQRHREGRAVPDQCARARRRPALCHHGVDLRRHRARGRALLQERRP